jgi:hypothetical protein
MECGAVTLPINNRRKNLSGIRSGKCHTTCHLPMIVVVSPAAFFFFMKGIRGSNSI